MAGDLTLALRTAQSGLLANQQALNAVANNVSNANTDGYSRKVVNVEQRVLAGNGAGVQLASLSRRIDEGLMKNLRTETGQLKAIQVQQPFFDRTQQLFGTPGDNSSLSHTLTQFAQALESLAMAPNEALDQRELVRQAQELTAQFNDLTAGIQDLRLEADQRIGEDVNEINNLIGEIADLNDKIVRNSTAGRGVTDLEDQRDLALDKLSGLIDTEVFKRGDGDVVVFTSGGQVLVDNVSAELTHHAASAIAATTTHAEGDFSGIYAGAELPANDITNEVRSGELKGLIELRDTILPNMQSTLDELAAQVRDTVNQIHNRGVAFPGLQEVTGTRAFVDETAQTVTMTGDTAVVLLDDAGNEVRSDTLTSATMLNGTSGTIEQVADALNTFLGGDGTADINGDGRLVITVSNPSYHLAFRDENGSGEAVDSSISFDADGDGNTDQTVQGFSNFFGLNDFFVDASQDAVFESDVLPKSFKTSAANLTFSNAGGVLGSGPVTIPADASLEDVVKTINSADAGVTASLVPDGAGVRLRIMSDDAQGITITDGPADTLLSSIDMHSADVGVAGTLQVRSDIAARPSLVARGAVQAKSVGSNTEYFASIGDDTVIKDLAAAFTTNQNLDTAGSLGAVSVTFDRYAADIVADNASLAAGNEKTVQYQEGLVSSLKAESDGVRGVNLDEEMSDLILYEQAYAAAARLIGVVQNMFESLERAVQ